MSFTGEQTWKLLVDFQYGGNQLDCAAIPPRGLGYVRKIPNLMAVDSGEVRLECFEWWYSTTAYTEIDFGAAATVSIYIKEADAVDDPLLIGTGATSKNASYGNTAYSVATASWDKGDILASYANKRCLLYVVVVNTDDQRTWYQEVNVVDPDGDTDATLLESSSIPISIQTCAADTNLTAYPGKLVVFVNAASNTVALTLPSASAYSTQEVVVVPINNTFAYTIVGTVNGWAGPITSAAGEMNGAHLFSNGTAWYNLNHTTVVR